MPRDGSRSRATSASRFASFRPGAAAPSPGRGFSGGDGAVSFNYPVLCACAAGAAHPVPSYLLARHRALAGTEGLRPKAPQFLGEAPGRRCVWRGAGKPGVAVRFRERLWDADPAAPGGLGSAAFPHPPLRHNCHPPADAGQDNFWVSRLVF